jgi:hypothetical protein
MLILLFASYKSLYNLMIKKLFALYGADPRCLAAILSPGILRMVGSVRTYLGDGKGKGSD